MSKQNNYFSVKVDTDTEFTRLILSSTKSVSQISFVVNFVSFSAESKPNSDLR